MATRVMFLAWAPFFSGAERALVRTLRALDRREFQPYVLAGTEGTFSSEVRALDIPCDIVPLTPLDRDHPLRSGLSVLRVVAAARRFRPRVIHANDMPSFQPGGYAGRLLGIPTVTHLRFPDGPSAYQWFFRPGFTRAIFISESFRSSAILEAPGMFDDRKSTVVYDAVDMPRAWSAEERLRRRRELGLPENSPVIALTGQVSEVKGIWEFVEAADRLRCTEAFFAVLGDDLKSGGLLRRRMEAKVDALGLSDRFRFLGFRPDAPELVQAFDVVAVPSHIEPFGLASLEAMAAGLPVVASKVGGIPEVVQESDTGFLVPPADAAALARALLRLLQSPTERARMGARGRERAETRFGLGVHAAALRAVYEEVAA